MPETKSAAAESGTQKHEAYQHAVEKRDPSLLSETGSKLEKEMAELIKLPSEIMFCEQTFRSMKTGAW